MQRFLVKTFVFVLPIAILLIVTEFALRRIPNDYRNKSQYLERNADKIETLILGSSHAMYGLNPAYFSENTFNASHVSQDFAHDFGILLKYKDDLRNLKTILLPIAYNGLFKDMETSREPWRVKNYWIYYNMHTWKNSKHITEVFAFRFPQNLDRLKSYYLKGKSEISCTPSGWGFGYVSAKSKDIESTGRIAAKRHTVDIYLDKYRDIYEMNVGFLRSIIEIASERGVKVMLFTAPAAASYRDNLKNEQLNMMTNTVRDLVAVYRNCSYINLLNDSEFVKGDFFDGDHLNENGAKKLSQRMDNYQWEKPTK